MIKIERFLRYKPRNKYNRYYIGLKKDQVPHMLVMERKIGNTIVRAYDDCFVKTEEERQKILETVERIAGGIHQEKEQKGKSG